MKTLMIDNKQIVFDSERNVLEIARKAGIDIPTFCYHSDLSVYGACRMCLVDIEGAGIVTSCSTIPAAGMVIKTNTPEIKKIRRINMELLLASHDRECTTCTKSGSCELQTLARKLGVDSIRFASNFKAQPIDTSSPSLVRNPNKCVLCGDCVRACSELQGIGAIDFAYRGVDAAVIPAFGKDLAEVDCVNCGQCARVCPTGAIVPKEEIDAVWNAVDNPKVTTVVQVAPAIRVALGEYFGQAAGDITTGKLVTALRRIGFDKVYDTCFTADMTVVEESNEFLHRLTNNGPLPIITSCCPAWVSFAEQNYPQLLKHLSTCKSPQQMFGAVAKEILPEKLKVDVANLKVVSVMPCTAKKFEARREEFAGDSGPEVDNVLTTKELARMIEASGLIFSELEDSPFDMPFGLVSGAGALFGMSGGVTEAVVRYVYEKLEHKTFDKPLFKDSENGSMRECELTVGGKVVRIAVVYSLAQAREICEQIVAGTCQYDLIEVMACAGGCINGAGQPTTSHADVVTRRRKGLRSVDGSSSVRAAQNNPALQATYTDYLGEPGGKIAHHLLHTTYQNRKRISNSDFDLGKHIDSPVVTVEICLGTNCCLHGAHDLLKKTLSYIEENALLDKVAVKGSFCYESCKGSANVKVNNEMLGKCTFEVLIDKIKANL